MKQHITLALDRELISAARVFAAEQGTSVSAMLAEELSEKIGSIRRTNMQNRLHAPCYSNLGRLAGKV